MNRHTASETDTARTRDPLFVAFVVLAVVVGVVAMATSARTLAALGEAVGWTQTVGPLSMGWALPIAVDALALVGGLAWLTTPKDSGARQAGVWTTVGAVAASIVLNGAGHLVELDRYTPGTKTVLVISAVPPVVAALVLHLVHLVASARTDTATVSAIADIDTAVPERAETDTAAPQFDTAGDTGDTPAVPECAASVDETGPGEYAVTMGDTNDTGIVPEPGGRLSDAELDAVVVVLTNETAPPRSYNELEARFRELGYVASAARLRAAWKRATDVSVH